MAITFPVSPVERAREPLPTRPFQRELERRVASTVEGCGGSVAALLEGREEHGLLACARRAFIDHRPMVLRWPRRRSASLSVTRRTRSCS